MTKIDIDHLIAKHFLCNAKGLLDEVMYATIYKAAVSAAKADILPKEPKVKKESSIPHISQRLQERYEIKGHSQSLKKIAALIKVGGPDIKIKRTIIKVVQEIDIFYEGKIVSVIYDKTDDKLVTALTPKSIKKKKT